MITLNISCDLLRDKPRHLRVLDAVAKTSGWSGKPPTGVHRGIAVHESYGSFVRTRSLCTSSRAGLPLVVPARGTMSPDLQRAKDVAERSRSGG